MDYDTGFIQISFINCVDIIKKQGVRCFLVIHLRIAYNCFNAFYSIASGRVGRLPLFQKIVLEFY